MLATAGQGFLRGIADLRTPPAHPGRRAVFALDGIGIGAGDTRFLMWGMLAAAVYVPVALLALSEGWGIVGGWCGLLGLIAVRLLTWAARFAGSRWALTGAPA